MAGGENFKIGWPKSPEPHLAFTDRGAIYNNGERLLDQTLLEGYRRSVWFAAALFRLNVAVGHGRGSGTHAHVGKNITF